MFDPTSPVVRTVIADDEETARNRLCLLLERIGSFDIAMECADGRETIAAVRNVKPDLLLLNVQMPDLDGFEVLKAIDLDPAPVAVLTANHDQFALRAFETNALDYVVKPFDEARLRRTLAKVRNELEKERARSLARHMASLFSEGVNPALEPLESHRLAIKSGGKIIFLNLHDVDWIEAAGNYVRFHMARESHVFRENISVVSTRLNRKRFVRIHRSAIVNIEKIKELQPCNSCEYVVVLENGKELPCSRSHRENLRQIIDAV
ncbi:MAG TPA: LytTR family DNA-binding domain-containing protein [Terriglobales bacterium]|nr:LytTR family DNA-binding domain-containing protein [Terriglobales bacterium]